MQCAYDLRVVRQFSIMTLVWGVVGMLVGVILAAQLIAYNALAVPLAALGLVPRYWAAIGMWVSSLVVVLNAWKLSRA